MITNVKKYIFVGVKEDLDTFFKRAQEKGFVEFISPKRRRSVEFPEHVQNFINALKILRKEPAVKPALLVKDLDPYKLARTVIENKNWLDKLLEQKRLLTAEIARIEPLGNFSLEEIRSLEQETKRHVQFFCVKRAKLKKLEGLEGLIHIASEYDMDYFMSISEKVENFSGMIEMHFEKSLAELKSEHEYALETIKKCEADLKENAAYVEFLKKHFLEALNQYNLHYASEDIETHMNDALFAVEGWIPKSRLHGLFPLLDGLGVHAEEVLIERDEVIPTYMENKGYGKIGEDLVHIYDTPATNDKDPSTWVFWAFAVFFAMIVSDAGYGLIYLSLALFLRKKFSHAKASIKRFFRLFTVIGAFCIVWGVLAGSYFGIDLAPKNSLNKLSVIHYLAVKKADYHIEHLDDVYKEWVTAFPGLSGVTTGEEFLQRGVEYKDGHKKYVILDDFRDSIFMEIALLVGVIHICLSLLRQTPRHFAGVGWVFAILGSYLYFPRVLESTSFVHFMHLISKQTGYKIGLQLLCGGVGLAVFLSVIQHKWKGVIELTKPIELFADVLSYLRLYALGLAGMILATTFNDMGRSVGFAAGFFIILLGHGINIVVGIMGGTIHGLRLNFIEWYHHCFDGGGKLFNPLKLLK